MRDGAIRVEPHRVYDRVARLRGGAPPHGVRRISPAQRAARAAAVRSSPQGQLDPVASHWSQRSHSCASRRIGCRTRQSSCARAPPGHVPSNTGAGKPRAAAAPLRAANRVPCHVPRVTEHVAAVRNIPPVPERPHRCLYELNNAQQPLAALSGAAARAPGAPCPWHQGSRGCQCWGPSDFLSSRSASTEC